MFDLGSLLCQTSGADTTAFQPVPAASVPAATQLNRWMYGCQCRAVQGSVQRVMHAAGNSLMPDMERAAPVLGSPPGTSMHGQPLHTAGDNINQRKSAAPSAPVPDVTHGVELVHWDSQRQRCPEAWSCPCAVWVLLAGVELAQDLQSCVSQRCWAQGELHLDCRYLTLSRLLCLLSLSCPEK